MSSCTRNESYQLYGIVVENSNYLSEQMKTNYLYSSLPLPQQLQNLLSEIIIFENNERIELSGYTQSKSINGEWVSSIIYLSSSHFQVETLLHEALHIYDTKLKISDSKSFHYVMNEEMTPNSNPRIYKYYEIKDYASEYFVESMLLVLSDSMQFRIHHPLTYHYLKKYALELKD